MKGKDNLNENSKRLVKTKRHYHWKQYNKQLSKEQHNPFLGRNVK